MNVKHGERALAGNEAADIGDIVVTGVKLKRMSVVKAGVMLLLAAGPGRDIGNAIGRGASLAVEKLPERVGRCAAGSSRL